MTDHIEDRAKAIYADQTMRHTGNAWNWDAAEDVVKERFRERASLEITDAPTVHVVIGVSADFGEHQSWVCGVFSTRAEAEEMAKARLAVRHTHDVWYAEYCKHREAATADGDNATDQIRAARAAAGPEPEIEPAQDFRFHEAKLGEWKTGDAT